MQKIDDIRSLAIRKAIANIHNRAEQINDQISINSVYVDCGILDRLTANKNEIITGRRGTGKTHLLMAYGQKEFINAEEKIRFCYIDCRMLDSGLLSGGTPGAEHSSLVFRRILQAVNEFLLKESALLETPDSRREAKLIEKLSQFNNVYQEYLDKKASVEPGRLIAILEEILDGLDCNKLVVALDEWVAIPEGTQPFLAERIKRFFIPSKKVRFKIAVVDYRTLMRTEINGSWIGLEKGADIFCDIDLDDYLVYDRDKQHVEFLFAQILFNHIFISLPEKNDLLALSPKEKASCIESTFFSRREAFVELVRAGEGVVRDFLKIFSNAYFTHFFPNQDKNKIAINDIRNGARDWYQKDKVDAIKGQGLEKCLGTVISEVIGARKARTFMVEQGLSQHPVLQKLFEARLLHLLRKGWSHKTEPGRRYDLFTIDYGAYVELINTKSCPQLDLFDNSKDTEDVVPFDDKRSIRRIVLTGEMLEKFHDR